MAACLREGLQLLDDLVRQGKVRYIGNSNFPAWRIAEAEYVARAMNVNRFVSCQDEYSLVVREIEKDLLPAAQQYNLGLLPFFPLASGLLTGKYQRSAPLPAVRTAYMIELPTKLFVKNPTRKPSTAARQTTSGLCTRV